MTPEGKVKQWAINKLKQEFPTAWAYSPRGGAFGVAGTPDRLMCINGLFVAIEFKAEGGQLTALQINQLKIIQQAGGIAAVLKGKDSERLNLIIRTIRAKLLSHGLQMALPRGASPSASPEGDSEVPHSE